MVKKCFKSMPWTAALVGVLGLLVRAAIWAGERNTAPAKMIHDPTQKGRVRPESRVDPRGMRLHDTNYAGGVHAGYVAP